MKNSFIHGVVILMCANAVSKILGAVLKIPLTYIMHEEGMAVYNTAFAVYAMVLSFVVSGVPFAVSKMTAEQLAKNNSGGAKAIVDASIRILFVIGVFGALLMWFCADFFATAMKEERAAAAIRAVAPSVLLVAVGDAAKSAFQGEGNMLPTAVSQCIEALIKLAAGYFFASRLIVFGTDKAAAGAIFGVSIGELAATGMLVISYIVLHRKIKRERGMNRIYTAEITKMAVPVLLMAVSGSALSVVDTSLIRANLLRCGICADEARYLYGAYSGYAMTVLNLPSGFLATLGVSIIPAISSAAATGDGHRVKKIARCGFFVCGVCSAFAAVVMAVSGEWILSILFKNTASADILRLSVPSVVFIPLMQLGGAVLQAMGHTDKAFASSLAAGGIKILSAIFLVSQPMFNIYGAAIGSDIAFFVGAAMNFISLSRLKSCKMCDNLV